MNTRIHPDLPLTGVVTDYQEPTTAQKVRALLALSGLALLTGAAALALGIGGVLLGVMIAINSLAIG